MDKLYRKLDRIKKHYNMEKMHDDRKNKEIFDAISLKDDVNLQTYNAENLTVNLFQKDVDFAVLKKKYHILHEDDNSYYCIEKIFKNARVLTAILNMYILIPKYGKKKIVCLFIKRFTGDILRFKSCDEDGIVDLKIDTNLYCEERVYAYIKEYDFEEEINCSLQSKQLYKFNSFKFDIENNNYLNVAKDYIEKKYLDRTVIFETYDNSDFKKYIKEPETYNPEYFDSLLSTILKNNYDFLRRKENDFKASIPYGKYVFKFDIRKRRENVVSQVYDTNEVYIGHLNVSVQVIKLEARIYLNKDLIYKKNINLREGSKVQDKISNHINGTIIVF